MIGLGSSLESFLFYIIGFAILFGVLVFLHELGHFLLAKWLRFRVDVFSLGFGPRVWGFRHRETDYRVSLIPLGGYVRIGGMDQPGGGLDPRDFYNRSMGSQLAVVVAGGLINIALGPLLISTAYMMGMPEPAFYTQPPVVRWVYPDSPAFRAGLRPGDRIIRVEERPVHTWREAQQAIAERLQAHIVMTVRRGSEIRELSLWGELDDLTGRYFYGLSPFPPNVVRDVQSGSSAARAGLQPGDVIFRINTTWIFNHQQPARLIQRSRGQRLIVHVYRKGQVHRLPVDPTYDERLRRWVIGIMLERPPVEYRSVRYSFFAAWQKGFEESIASVGLFFRAVRNILTGSLSAKALMGPISMARIAGSALYFSIAVFLYIMGLISIQLGIINLLPIPALDGGHATLILVSGIMRRLTGRQLSPQIREWITIAGLVLLVGLILLVLTLDIMKLRG